MFYSIFGELFTTPTIVHNSLKKCVTCDHISVKSLAQTYLYYLYFDVNYTSVKFCFSFKMTKCVHRQTDSL